jgi:hypothetical protein
MLLGRRDWICPSLPCMAGASVPILQSEYASNGISPLSLTRRRLLAPIVFGGLASRVSPEVTLCEGAARAGFQVSLER